MNKELLNKKAKLLLSVLLFGLLSSLFFIKGNMLNHLMRAYVHNGIDEKEVPELKGFKQKIRDLFALKDDSQKDKLRKEIISSGNLLMLKLKSRLQEEDDITVSQRKTINQIIEFIQEKVSNLKNIKSYNK